MGFASLEARVTRISGQAEAFFLRQAENKAIPVINKINNM